MIDSDENWFVRVQDSNGQLYLVGFGESGHYLTDVGGHADAAAITEDFKSISTAYYDDNNDGVDNLALLNSLVGAGVSFANTDIIVDPEDYTEPQLNSPAYVCDVNVLHIHVGGDDLGYVFDDDVLFSGTGAIGCSANKVEEPTGQTMWMETAVLSALVSGSGSALCRAYNSLIMILAGRIPYQW